jgi:hypothetical protein
VGESLLILAPLLVLAAVLVLGFAGCDFEAAVVPEAGPFLLFRARVPTSLHVLGPVTFSWIRPQANAPETVDIAVFAHVGDDHVYQVQVHFPGAGIWVGRCRMTMDVGGGPDVGGEQISTECLFTWPPDPPADKALVFVTGSNPAPPPTFRVVCEGLQPA